MKFKQRTLLVVLGCIIAFLVWLLYGSQVRLSSFKNQVDKLKLNSQTFQESLDSQGRIVAEQEQLILNQKDAIRLYGLQVEDLKKLKSQVVTITETVIDSIFIEFHDTLRVSDTIYPKGVIQVPKRFDLITEHYSLNGLVLLDGLKVDSMAFSNKMKITIGDKKMGWFKKSKPVVKIENSNPYMGTIDMKNVIIEENKKFYQKNTFWLGVGALGAFLILK
jgi:hypothetical protein